MLRFIHAADLHLDTPATGLERVDAGLAELLRDASLVALDELVSKALEVRAAFVVLAGDVYDGPAAGVRARVRLRRAMETLADAGIRVFVAKGNHDAPERGWAQGRAWPELVTFFPPRRPEATRIEVGGQVVARVQGVSYSSPKEPDNLAARFEPGGGPWLEVGVLHTSLEASGPYAPCPPGQLPRLDYWALGHVHQHRVVARDPWVVYPGCTQGRGFGPGEIGPKGAVVVTWDPGSAMIHDVTWFSTDTVRFYEVRADITDSPDLITVASNLAERAGALRAEAPSVGLVLRASLHGRGDVYQDLVTREEELLDALADLSGTNVWWAGVRLSDQAGPGIDLERVRAEGEFGAQIIETWLTWAEHGLPPDLANEVRRAAAKAGLSSPEEALPRALMEVLSRLTPGERG